MKPNILASRLMFPWLICLAQLILSRSCTRTGLTGGPLSGAFDTENGYPGRGEASTPYVSWLYSLVPNSDEGCETRE